jgi:hypothetical protein
MSAKEISRVVKSHTNPEPEQEPDETDEPEQETDGDDGTEQETVTVWDKDGKEYAIPVDVLKKYAV